MPTAFPLNTSPLNLLRSLRGTIADARISYPEVLHVEVRDAHGDLWRLVTQDADWSLADPVRLVGRSIDDANIDGQTGVLRCRLSDGTMLDVAPAAVEATDDPPNWELVSPGGLLLEFGPGMRWRIGGADDLTPAQG